MRVQNRSGCLTYNACMFVHLRLHTEFSIVDGTNRVDDVVQAAADDGQPALAITDLNNLFGAIKFYKAAQAKGVKPLIGADVWVQATGREDAPLARLLLLVQNQQGYLNLCELLSRAWTHEPIKGQSVMRLAWLQELSTGLLALSGAQMGDVGQALVQGDLQRASDMALQWAAVFPHRFYLELQRCGRPDDELHVREAVQLAARLKLPVAATHAVQYLQPDDYEAHEARVCISEGEILANQRRVRRKLVCGTYHMVQGNGMHGLGPNRPNEKYPYNKGQSLLLSEPAQWTTCIPHHALNLQDFGRPKPS